MARHLNEYFRPVEAVDAEHVTFAAGVTALNQACAMVTCDADRNEAIMLGMPVYSSFSKDLAFATG